MVKKSILIAFFIRCFNALIQIFSVLFLSKNLSLNEFGIYTGFIIILGYFHQLGRFGMMEYLTRKISIIKKKYQTEILYQIWLYMIITTLFAAVFSLPFLRYEIINGNYYIYFITLLFLGCFSLQLENFAIATRRALVATFNVTLRNIWIPILIIFKILFEVNYSLNTIFVMMILSEILSIMYILQKNEVIKINPHKFYKFDFDLFKNTIKGGFLYSIINLSTLLIISNQRIFLEFFGNSQDVGIFQFFFLISTGIPNLLETTLYTFLLPNLISKNKYNKNKKIFISFKERFYLLFSSAIFLVLIFFMLDSIIYFIGKDELINFKNIYYLVSIYALFHINFRIKFTNLYSAKKDYLLLKSQLITLSLTLIFSYIFVRQFNIYGAAISLIFSCFIENISININGLNKKDRLLIS